jgi:hypothetical protein
MHDELIEQRLRAALRTEAAALPFTITGEELRRRHRAARRSRLGRSGTLLLAAAVGVGLVSVGAVVGGWLDDRRPPQPEPSRIAILPPTSVETSAPSGPRASDATVSLPTLDELTAPLETSRLVRAQAVGPATAPASWSATGNDVVPSGGATFAPTTVAGSYRVWFACLGPGARIVAHRAAPGGDDEIVPVTCDGGTTARDVGLEVGDRLGVEADEPVSWRIAVVSPERAPLRATALGDAVAAAGLRLEGQAASDRPEPDYLLPVAAVSAPRFVDQLGLRDRFHVFSTCAGPAPVTWILAPKSPTTGLADVADLAGQVRTTVECDGRVHEDDVRVPFPDGADLYVSAPPQVAWRIAASSDPSPIDAPRNGDGWTLLVGVGGPLNFHPEPDHLDGTLDPAVTGIRVVITCLGGRSVDVGVRSSSAAESESLTTFTAPCGAGDPHVTAVPVDVPAGSYDVRWIQSGAMWLNVTVQRPVGG